LAADLTIFKIEKTKVLIIQPQQYCPDPVFKINLGM